MLTITYDPNFTGCVPDGRVKEVAGNIISYKDQKKEITVSNELVVDELRLRIKRGEILGTEIAFRFKGEDIPIDEEGYFIEVPPKGFCDTGLGILEEILFRSK